MGLDPKELLTKATELAERFAADNARLRALIKLAERDAEDVCPWCSAGNIHLVDTGKRHKADCPAFTPEGEVK